MNTNLQLIRDITPSHSDIFSPKYTVKTPAEHSVNFVKISSRIMEII